MDDNLSVVQNYFSNEASKYDSETEWRKNATILDCIEEFYKEIKKGVVVDLGTGTGLVAERLIKHNRLTIGLDISKNMLLIAKNRINNVAQANIYQLPLQLASIDCLTMRQVLHYLDIKSALPEIIRYLKYDGHLISADIIVSNRSDLLWWTELKRLVQPLRKHFLCKDDNLKLLERMGLLIEKQRHITIWRNDSWATFLKHVPPRTCRRKRVYELLDQALAGSVTFPIKVTSNGVEYLQSWLITRSKRVLK